MAAGRRSSSEKSSEATRSGEDAPGNEAVPGRQAAPGEAAEAGHLAGAGRRAAALEAVRASAATRARYSLSTARRTKAAVEERQLVAAIEASLESQSGVARVVAGHRGLGRTLHSRGHAARMHAGGGSHRGMHRGTRQPCRHPVVAPAREAPSARGRLDVPLPIARRILMRILETSVA